MDRRHFPLIGHVLNVNLLFLGGWLYPLFRDLAVAGLLLVFLGLNGAVLLGRRRRLDALDGAVRNSRRTQNVLLLVSSAVVTFGAVEYLARLATDVGLLEYDSGIKTMLPPGTEDWRLAHITADKYREPDPVLLWRPLDRRPYTSQRFKGPEIAEIKPPGTFRVFCYGDSNTDGPKQGSWPARLQTLLGERGAPGIRFEVLNAGVAGYSSYQGLLRFRQECARYEPDLVLVSFGWNDVATALGAPDKAYRPPSPAAIALQRALLRYRFYRLARFYLPRPEPEARELVGPRVPRDDYIANMEDFLDTAGAHQAEIVFLTRPHREKRAVLLEVRHNWRGEIPLYNRDLLSFGERTGQLVIDVQEIFETRYPDLFADGAHFTPQGHGVMAILLLEQLSAAGLLRARDAAGGRPHGPPPETQRRSQ